MRKKWAIPLTLSKVDRSYYVRYRTKYHYFCADNISLCKKYDLRKGKVEYFDGEDAELEKLYRDDLVCKKCYKILAELSQGLSDEALDKENLKEEPPHIDYDRLEKMIGKIVIHESGRRYVVLGVSTHTETKEKLVIYRATYKGSIFRAKPVDLFLKEVDYTKNPDTKQKYVFELLD